MHDAAIVAWGLKGKYDTVRPISVIRYMGGEGQSSDPDHPAYDPDGLPLVPGLIEVVTRSRERPAAARGAQGHVGEIAIHAWPGDRRIRRRPPACAGSWRRLGAVPAATFVTPAFPGFASGHSTFSRAAAEVLTGFTGSEYFPGGSRVDHPAGLAEGRARPDRGRHAAVGDVLRRGRPGGRSRLYGGIHMEADDLMGRRIGSECGIDGVDRRPTLLRRHGRLVTGRGRRLAVGAGLVAVGRSWRSPASSYWAGSRRPLALDAPRFVDETATAGLVHTSDGGPTSQPGAGWPSSIATGTASRISTSPAAPIPPRCSATGATSRGGLGFAPVGDRRPTSSGSPARIRSMSTRDGHAGPRRAAGRGNRSSCAASVAAGSSPPARDTRVSPRIAAGRRRSAPRGRGDAGATHDGLSGTTWELDAAGRANLPLRGERLGCFRPDASGAYGPAIALDPGYCPLSMLFSDWDGSGRRDLRVSNDRHYYDAANGGEQLWRMDPGAPPRLYTQDDGWVLLPAVGDGDRQPRT